RRRPAQRPLMLRSTDRGLRRLAGCVVRVVLVPQLVRRLGGVVCAGGLCGERAGRVVQAGLFALFDVVPVSHTRQPFRSECRDDSRLRRAETTAGAWAREAGLISRSIFPLRGSAVVRLSSWRRG